MASLITCPGCKHKLTVPADFGSQRAQCPRCGIEFATADSVDEVASAPPPLEVSPPKASAPTHPVQTAFADAESTPARAPTASARAWFYCVMCGGKVAEMADECPGCGYRIHVLVRDQRPQRRRPRSEILQPVNGTLAVLGAILCAVGIAFMIAAPIVHDLTRWQHRNREVFPLFLLFLGCAIELAALVFCLIWLYQAWRMVLHGDEEFSPGLMVGLLFVPFFNFFWMFRAIPGLSGAIYQELKVLAPNRSYGAGWIPGVIACVTMLIPYFQPIAVCMFLAWMLLTNNALYRLARFHEEWRAQEQREEEE